MISSKGQSAPTLTVYPAKCLDRIHSNAAWSLRRNTYSAGCQGALGDFLDPPASLCCDIITQRLVGGFSGYAESLRDSTGMASHTCGVLSSNQGDALTGVCAPNTCVLPAAELLSLPKETQKSQMMFLEKACGFMQLSGSPGADSPGHDRGGLFSAPVRRQASSSIPSKPPSSFMGPSQMGRLSLQLRSPWP